jgi:hypothetical protein
MRRMRPKRHTTISIRKRNKQKSARKKRERRRRRKERELKAEAAKKDVADDRENLDRIQIAKKMKNKMAETVRASNNWRWWVEGERWAVWWNGSERTSWKRRRERERKQQSNWSEIVVIFQMSQ